MPLLPKTFACIAVGVAAFAAVEAGHIHDHVLDELERKLDEQFVGDFTASRLTGTLLWGFTAHNVEIRDGRGEAVALIDEMQVEASAFELLDGKLRFDHARFVRPDVLVERLDDGTTNFDEVFSSRDSDDKSRPAGRVLFEMTRAEIVDGEFIFVDASDSATSVGRMLADGNSSGGKLDETTNVTSAGGVTAHGTFRVLSGERTETVIERLDADIFPHASSHADAAPRRLSVQQARLGTDAGACSFSADSATVDDRWRVEAIHAHRPNKFAADSSLVTLRGRASSPEGGWLTLDGRIDREDRSYDLVVAAEDFETAGWPGAPDWSWLVLDGAGTIAGRGWSRDEMDATLRWTAHDVDVAGEPVAELHLVAHARDQRLDVEKLEVTAAEFLASARGHVAESGAFSLEVDTHADGAFAKRLASQLGFEHPSAALRDVARFQVSTKASGKLDLSARSAAQVFDRAKADTTWKASDVILDDLRWGVAGGSLEIRLPSTPRNERNVRRFSYEATAAMHDLHYGALDADVMRTSMRGRGTFGAGTDSGIGGVSYKLELDADGVQLGEHRAKKARMAISGAFSPTDEGSKWPLETLAAKGRFDLFQYRSSDLEARRVAANIDLSGAFPIGEGLIEAHMTGLRTQERRFRHARMELRLLEDQKFRFESKARVEVSYIPDLPLYLDISGRHGQSFEALTLDKLAFGRPGMRWKTRKPGLVLFEDGALVLQSLTLHRRAQRVRLDGAYGHGKKGSISDITSRLKNAQLRSFFDLSGIKRGLRNIF